MRYLLFSFLVISVSFWACGGSSMSKEEVSEILTENPWRWDVQAITDSMNKLTLAESEYRAIMGILKRMETGVFEFKKDGSMTLMALGESRSGTWELTDPTTLMMNLPSIRAVPNKIVAIERGRFMIGAEKSKGELFPKILVPATPSGSTTPPAPQDTTATAPADSIK